jgi:hypothetical protein
MTDEWIDGHGNIRYGGEDILKLHTRFSFPELVHIIDFVIEKESEFAINMRTKGSIIKLKRIRKLITGEDEYGNIHYNCDDCNKEIVTCLREDKSQ